MPINKKKKIVIGFVGQICSGKGSAVAYLAKKHKADTVMFSQSMRDILKRLFLPVSRENLQKISLLLRDGFGQDVFSKTVAGEIALSKNNLIGVDGVRRWSDVLNLKEDFSFYLVYVESEAKIRWQRLVKRNQNDGDNSVSWQKFLLQQKAEAELQIVGLKEKADFVLENNGSMKDFYINIDKIIKQIK